MSNLTARSKKKQLGAFYTPQPMARSIVNWAVRSPDETVMDPGCGEAVFLLEAYQHLVELGASAAQAVSQIQGVEVDEVAYDRACRLLTDASGVGAPGIICADFFQVQLDLFGPPPVDVIVGNPPYVRYHHFKGAARRRALQSARRAGVELTRLTSSWAPYLIHAISFLKPGGRLAMVVPAELLQVDYAEPVRRFLLERFATVAVVTFDERVFPDVLEDTVILLAESDGPAPGLRVIRLENLDDLTELGQSLRDAPIARGAKHAQRWTRYLLPRDSLSVYQTVVETGETTTLGELGTVDIGVVTGSNAYFLLTEAKTRWWEIEPDFLRPAAPKPRLMPGARFSVQEWERLRDQSVPCYLLNCQLPPSVAAEHRVWSYIERGVEKGVHKGYKCRNREPWYTVPGVRVPPAFLTYMAHEIPRLIVNEAQVVNHNLIHGLYFHDEHEMSPEEIAIRVASFYTTFTMLSVELVGRSYGGGVLKLETKESERIRLIEPSGPTRRRLIEALPLIDEHLRRRAFDDALAIGDEILLLGQLAIDQAAYEQLCSAYQSIRGRRLSRAQS
ncbi:MAG: class I SAM-dependent DNA methyltransferase [Anaerolineae bacterium]